MRFTIPPTLALIACLLACLGLPCHPTLAADENKKPVTLTRDEAAVYETVFRHQFAKNASSTQQSAGAYFISIQGADPAADFLARFAKDNPPVKKASEAKHSGNSTVIDPASGKMSLLFRLDTIKWLGKDDAEVDGGYYEGNLSSSGNTYHVKRTKDGWQVTDDKMHWISLTPQADRPIAPIAFATTRAPAIQ